MNENPLQERELSEFILELKDYFLTQEGFVLRKNPEFGFLETYPQPLENLNKYYESKDYISHSDSNKSISDKTYQLIKVINIRHKFSMLGNIKKGAKILDYGCGTGDFLAFAKSKDLDVLGVEPNESAREITQKKVGKNSVLNSDLKDISETFDIITLWHVLEHIPNLYEFIEELKKHLNPNGEILIAVPNHLSFDAKFYKKHWAAYDVPRHLWHFSPKSMDMLFNNFGMKIEKRYALWFDSFYVSLLSEKYKKTEFGFFRAVAIALISNLIGIFTGNFSSVVYKITKNPI
ncbi:class I SAM-dependent methyltransferase [Moheibacter sediminis]|uniref:Methyltransferase domain-containing protein n=1 Tax=Moheibacter sediminis TaxID=1434700 RepID=A0A1W1Y6T3_9FLAO|nr:class I SAM-dependent methyltransferase [Moheibacter sediminis]SMC31900.1 Methyltransferase domain-containing protein [Moheibacter sediminis]